MILEENFNKRRRNLRLKYYVILGVFFLTLTGIYWAVVSAPFIHFKKIVPEPGASLSESEINSLLAAKANSTVWGRFLGYTNFLLWGDGEIDISSDRVRGLRLTRDLSGGVLNVATIDREHRLIWCVSDSSCVWVDGLGFAGSDAPLVDGQLVDAVWAGERLVARGLRVLPAEQFERLLKVLEIIHSQNINISGLELDESTGDLTARTLGGIVIYFSLRNDTSFIASVLADFQKSWRMIRYIDLRIENRAYFQ